MEKLFVVVRNDLDPGLQAAQMAHAAIQYVCHYGAALAWFRDSNNLVLLQVPDEACLRELVERVKQKVPACPIAPFQEPDLDWQLTATAFGDEAKKLLGSLPLALRPRPGTSP